MQPLHRPIHTPWVQLYVASIRMKERCRLCDWRATESLNWILSGRSNDRFNEYAFMYGLSYTTSVLWHCWLGEERTSINSNPQMFIETPSGIRLTWCNLRKLRPVDHKSSAISNTPPYHTLNPSGTPVLISRCANGSELFSIVIDKNEYKRWNVKLVDYVRVNNVSFFHCMVSMAPSQFSQLEILTCQFSEFTGIRRWLQVYDSTSTAIRPPFDSISTAIRPRYDHSTTYVTTLSLPECGLLHCGRSK